MNILLKIVFVLNLTVIIEGETILRSDNTFMSEQEIITIMGDTVDDKKEKIYKLNLG